MDLLRVHAQDRRVIEDNYLFACSGDVERAVVEAPGESRNRSGLECGNVPDRSQVPRGVEADVAVPEA